MAPETDPYIPTEQAPSSPHASTLLLAGTRNHYSPRSNLQHQATNNSNSNNSNSSNTKSTVTNGTNDGMPLTPNSVPSKPAINMASPGLHFAPLSPTQLQPESPLTPSLPRNVVTNSASLPSSPLGKMSKIRPNNGVTSRAQLPDDLDSYDDEDEDDEDEDDESTSFGQDENTHDDHHHDAEIQTADQEGEVVFPGDDNDVRRVPFRGRGIRGRGRRRASNDFGDLHDAFVAKEASRTTNCAGYGVLISLLLVGGVLATITYFYVTGNETHDFELEYDVVKQEVVTGIERNAHELYERLQFLAHLIGSAAMPVTAIASSSIPEFYVARSIDEFESFAGPIREAFNLSAIVYAPWLTSEFQQNTWAELLTSPSSETAQSTIPLVDWIPQSYEILGTTVESQYQIPSDLQLSYIWQYDRNLDTATMIPDVSLPSAPMSLGSPPPIKNTAQDIPQVPYFNYNLLSNDVQNTNNTAAYTGLYKQYAYQTIRDPALAFLSEPLDYVDFFAGKIGHEALSKDVPHSLGIIPVALSPSVAAKSLQEKKQTQFQISNETNRVMGHLSTAIPWTALLANILQDDQNGLTVVVDSCNDGAFINTFELNGKSVAFVGSGDRHSHLYSEYAHSAFFYGFVNRSSLVDVDYYCKHKLTVYPTTVYKDSFESSDPVLFAAVAAGIIAFAIFLFVSYGSIFRRQQNFGFGGFAETAPSKPIVTTLFPGKMARKLFLETSRHSHSVRSDMGKSTGTVNLMNFMHKGEIEIAEATRPIAELFPDATVLFGDIAGFTAWSSIREPSQVFMLLESIFQAFDNIARSFGVFKVETVGDCYMACCGVPEPNEDHATVMAQFARECLQKFRLVVQDLELKLGPDTGDLAMRMGMNSGPVTAGVLRGERARFQLFGDTVNTAARMESTGVRDRIQLSEQTAQILINHGRANWVKPREDKVEAKGKGILSTYWLQEEVEATRLWHDDGSEQAGGVEGFYFEGDASQLPDIPEKVEVQTNRSSDDGSSHRRNEFSAKNSEKSDALDHVRSSHNKMALGNSTHARKSLFPKTEDDATAQAAADAVRKKQRLVDWNTELLLNLLKQVVARRFACGVKRPTDSSNSDLVEMAQYVSQNRMPVDEVAEIIVLPEFDENITNKSKQVSPDTVVLTPEVTAQCKNYVALIASMYRDNPFHNFEHASHVTMSVSKLLSRIIAPELDRTDSGPTHHDRRAALLHDHTYGITSDPLTQFAVVLSALVHDVDHRGVPNFLLIKEDKQLAVTYRDKSVAEQNSVDVAWKSLMQPEFAELRNCIFADSHELRRFRALLVNSVIATDIFDKELGALRRNRWAKAFAEPLSVISSNNSEAGSSNAAASTTASSTTSSHAKTKQDVNRKATIVIEHLIQASDVAHTMQHWHVYQKWNERLFQEMYQAYLSKRSEKDPSKGWYEGELGFFDNYIIPLAKKLKDCGVFGVASDEYLNYALGNRREWADKGHDLVSKLVEKYRPLMSTAESDDEEDDLDEDDEFIDSDIVHEDKMTGTKSEKIAGSKLVDL